MVKSFLKSFVRQILIILVLGLNFNIASHCILDSIVGPFPICNSLVGLPNSKCSQGRGQTKTDSIDSSDIDKLLEPDLWRGAGVVPRERCGVGVGILTSS